MLAPIIEDACQVEVQFNPYFIDQFYIFLSVSSSTIASQESQRRGGWQIDGHQGFERLKKNGEKMPCDRQYIMSNVIPTEFIPMDFDFNNIRKYCSRNWCDLDAVNMQDVIEQYASRKEAIDPYSIVTVKANTLYHVNPYMAHRAAINQGLPVHRTFVRISCSTYPRDRLGDPINPSFGPIFLMKIKTITDIHEVPESIL